MNSGSGNKGRGGVRDLRLRLITEAKPYRKVTKKRGDSLTAFRVEALKEINLKASLCDMVITHNYI